MQFVQIVNIAVKYKIMLLGGKMNFSVVLKMLIEQKCVIQKM